MPDAVYGRHVFTIDLLWLKNAPKWIPYDALGDQLKHFFVQHYRPKMDAVYNRHVLGTKTCLSWSGNAPEMGAMWQRLPQFSMLNPFLLLKQNAPQIDAFYVKVVFWLFCLTSCPQHGCFLCERCCQLRFSVWYNAPEINVFCDVFNVTPFFG